MATVPGGKGRRGERKGYGRIRRDQRRERGKGKKNLGLVGTAIRFSTSWVNSSAMADWWRQCYALGNALLGNVLSMHGGPTSQLAGLLLMSLCQIPQDTFRRLVESRVS